MKDSQLSARLAGVSQRFLELFPQWFAIDASLSFKTVWNASVVVLSIYRFMRSSNFMPRASTLLAWADVRVGFPSALMRVVALMAFFCSIHSFLCNCGDRMDRLDRYLKSEGCNTLSIEKTSGKARVLSIRIQSDIVFLYIIIIVPTFSVTPNNCMLWRLPTILRDAPWRISILISIITTILLLLLFLLLLLLFL